jgi:hypothetical protein
MVAMAEHGAPRTRGLREEPLLLLVLVFVYGWLFVFFPRLNNPNELSRLYMARALAEHGTYAIGVRTAQPGGGFADSGPIYSDWGYVNDKALVCDDARAKPPGCTGKLYAAKAPGASLLAAPLVAAANRLWHAVLRRAPTRSELIFLLRWILVIAPSILLWLFLRRFLLRAGVEPALTRVAVLAGACGSLSLTYGQMFAGHQLGSLALAAAFLTAFWPQSGAALRDPLPAGAAAAAGSTGAGSTGAGSTGAGSTGAGSTGAGSTGPGSTSTWRALALGACAGASVVLEYPCAPAALLVLAGWVAFTRPARAAIVAAALGASLPLLLLAHFHTVAFGAPWRTPYGHLENPGFVRDLAPGFLGISPPSWERIQGSLLSPFLGLFYWAPWTLLALPAAAAIARDALALALGVPGRRTEPDGRTARGAFRALSERDPPLGAALTASGVVAYELVFQITHALWRSGWTVGPRYIAPIVPFAAALIALALQRLRGGARARRFAIALFGGSAAAGIGATGLASAVCQGFPLEVYNPLVEVVWPLLSHGYSAPNLLQRLGVPGLWSALPYFLALIAAAAACIAAAAAARPDQESTERASAAAGSPHRESKPGAVWAALAALVFALFTVAQWTAVAGDTPAHAGAARFLAESWDPNPPPGSSPLTP